MQVQDSDLGWDVRLAALSFLRGWLCSPAAPANHARLTGLRLHEAVAHVTAAASNAEDGPNMHIHKELLRWVHVCVCVATGRGRGRPPEGRHAPCTPPPPWAHMIWASPFTSSLWIGRFAMKLRCAVLELRLAKSLST